MPDYSQGKIYKIVNDVNDKIYVGSTCKKYLSDRMGGHRTAAKQNLEFSPVYQEMRRLSIEHFKIVLIELFPCKTRAELEAREFHIIRRFIRLGEELLNSTIEYGKHSIAAKRKMTGSCNHQFKRGCLRRVETDCPHWRFTWQKEGKQTTRSFSINKYGEKRAKRLAEKVQNEIYPLKTHS